MIKEFIIQKGTTIEKNCNGNFMIGDKETVPVGYIFSMKTCSYLSSIILDPNKHYAIGIVMRSTEYPFREASEYISKNKTLWGDFYILFSNDMKTIGYICEISDSAAAPNKELVKKISSLSESGIHRTDGLGRASSQEVIGFHVLFREINDAATQLFYRDINESEFHYVDGLKD